ncbi:MAG: preprotein translocase subunit SecA [Patescibacteria group bacterium]
MKPSFLERFGKLFGDENEKALKKVRPLLPKINALEPEIQKLTDVQLKAKTAEFKARIAAGTTLDALLPEAFAVVREASRRTLGQRHFDVQLVGGAIIHGGGIAEMRTGEGKTLVATLPAYLNALAGKGVHVVTVNDYLSRRDAVWMGKIYSFLGLSVSVLNHEASYLYDPAHVAPTQTEAEAFEKKETEQGFFKVVHEFMRPCSRRDAYLADITYGTNHEFGFDYLRDNIEYESKMLRQRPPACAIVDEIDSILIDEARTPLIISAPARDSGEMYAQFAKIAATLEQETDYTVDEKFHSIALTDAGITKAEKAIGVDNIYTEKGIAYVHHLETAVRAKALYHREKEYVVKEGEVMIVDEFTGRLQPGRRWSEGLHQAVEAKEGVKVQQESRTYASITYQNLFRLYPKLSGMTGTALTSKEEFFKVYGLETVSIPTHREITRKDHNDQIFQTEAGKFQAIARKVKELNTKGQPVLIGTVSIEKNQLLSAFLKQEGVKHELLNAKPEYAEREGEIVAQAGKRGAVTISTNMAGRGVDIKLGGATATPAEYEEVKALGGLFVLGTERHEARRIDNQLRGRAGRQGDPGDTQFFVSLEDNLMRIFASDTVKKMMGRLNIPDDQAIENIIITKSLESAQTKIEGFHFDARKQVLEYDDVLNLQRLSIYEKRRKVLLGTQADVDAALDQYVVESGSVELAEAIRKVIAEKREKLGEAEFYATIRRLLLQSTDLFWVEHLEAMDYIRSSVRLRAYGQRDPLVEYKKEGLLLFKRMEQSAREQVLKLLPNIGAGAFVADEKAMRETQKKMHLISGDESAPANAAGSANSGKVAIGDGTFAKVGRNDDCPCGSGKKYKKCHGA